jgi:hypothetical protein
MEKSVETELTVAELRDFRRLAGIMIPADAAYRVPGADDPAIFLDLVGTLGRDTTDVRSVLALLSTLANENFAALDDARAEALAMKVLAQDRGAVHALGRTVLSAYYRDDRVMISVGREPRPPFPKGHVMPESDWSVLDVVKRRPALWRDDRGS